MKVLLIILLIITALVLGLLAYKNTTNKMPHISLGESKKSEDKKDRKDKKDKNKDEAEEMKTSPTYEVIEKYNMPELLSEVSDICHLRDNLFACVQDELGKIFIYNTGTKKIEKEVLFAGRGDYEGIAVAGSTAYVVNSSGTIFEVAGFESANPVIKEYKTYLKAQNDVEGLCYDKAQNRLLLAYKADEDDGNSKGIYAFDLINKQLAKSPAYSIDFNDPIISNGSKKKKAGIKPSALAIHPKNGDLYIIEGTNPKLLILDSKGKITSFMPLGSKDFEQPEGITFNTDGELFISNEGKKDLGNILKVKF